MGGVVYSVWFFGYRNMSFYLVFKEKLDKRVAKAVVGAEAFLNFELCFRGYICRNLLLRRQDLVVFSFVVLRKSSVSVHVC